MKKKLTKKRISSYKSRELTKKDHKIWDLALRIIREIKEDTKK